MKSEKSMFSVPRAALYIRVSTEEQAKQGYSIPAQREDLEGYARIYFINEDLSNFMDFTALNANNFQEVRKRILIVERGQLFHYLRSMRAYYIGTHICGNCLVYDGLVDIPLRVGDDATILTAAVYAPGARKDPNILRYIKLLREVAERR